MLWALKGRHTELCNSFTVISFLQLVLKSFFLFLDLIKCNATMSYPKKWPLFFKLHSPWSFEFMGIVFVFVAFLSQQFDSLSLLVMWQKLKHLHEFKASCAVKFIENKTLGEWNTPLSSIGNSHLKFLPPFYLTIIVHNYNGGLYPNA